MQKLDIRDIRKSLGAHVSVTLEETLSVEGATLRGPVHVDVKATNAGSRILLAGRIQTVVELTCARCAQVFGQTLDIDLLEEFLPSGSPELPQGPDLHPEELNVFVYDEDRIDLDEVVRQNILAALPIQPICREDCAGLCAQCGANRNEAPCGCTESRIDPRWEGLKKFIKTD